MSWRHFLPFLLHLSMAAAQLTSASLQNYVGSLTLTEAFNPIKDAYWTGFPHHRRTPFAVSPDGKSAYLAYLDASETGVHVQQVNPSTFAAVGQPVTVTGGKEAGGLVAHNDGFALLTNEVVAGEADGVAIAVLYRYTGSEQTFKTFLGGAGIDTDMALASPDINGDLVYSEAAGYYAVYIVVTAYEGSTTGHFGDAIRYITTSGDIKTIAGASSSWGCSHNTGIAFEAADAPPFASLCAEDQGAIWLNTETQGMSNNGVKVSNEMTINGASNEPMGGMSGSYSSLARFIGQDSYAFAWVSRGAVDLTLNDWMGEGYTKAQNRTNNRNVAVAIFSDKATLVGEQATSEVGAADGDSQITWITESTNDCSNAHVAAFDGSHALVSWEEISSPICPFEAMGCEGTFAGTSFQMVDGDGGKVGEAITSADTLVAGDMVTMGDGRICWPYVAMDWELDGAKQGSSVTKMSFACMSADGSGDSTTATLSAAETVATEAASVSPTTSATSATSASLATSGSTVSTISTVSQSAEAEEPATTLVSSSELPSGPRPSLTTLPDSLSSSLVIVAPSEATLATNEQVTPTTSEAVIETATPDEDEDDCYQTKTKTQKVCPVFTEIETVYVTATAAFGR